MDVIILSAGLGSRLKPVTHYLPKPMIAINREPLIRRHLRYINEISENIFINLSFHAAALLSYIADPKILFFYEPQPRGTWPFIKEIATSISLAEKIILISADIYVDEQFYLSLKKENITPCFYFNNKKSIDNFAGLAILKRSDILESQSNSLAEFILEFQDSYDVNYVSPFYKNISTVIDWQEANQLGI